MTVQQRTFKKTKSINEFDMIWNYLTLVVYDEKSIHVCHVIGTEQNRNVICKDFYIYASSYKTFNTTIYT